jgi:hypothetical protein
MRYPGSPGKMKLLQRERTHTVDAVSTNPPPCLDALGDTALRGWTVKWIHSFGIGNSRPGFLLILTFMMVMVFSLNAGAQNQYYVSTSGSDSSNGTSPSTPWRTCSHAIAAFSLGSGGAVINFSPGDYGTCTINRGGASLTNRLALQCTQQWTVGGSNCRLGFMVTSANNVDIGKLNKFGFEYTNPSAYTAVNLNTPCAAGSGQCSSGNSIHVLGNYFHDIAQSAAGGCPSAGAILMTNAHGVSVTDTQVIGNVIDHYGTYPPSSGCYVAHGMYITTSGGQVYNNIVTRSAYAALQYYDQACNARISNNVFANNGIGMVLYGGNSCSPVGNNTVNNNIIVNNVQQAINNSFKGDQGCSAGNPTLYTNNIIFGGGTTFTSTPASCTIIQNQMSENPTATFVRYTGNAAGDYHLKSGSVAFRGGTTRCAAGSTTQCVPSIDLAATARPGTPSLGVFESGGASSASVSAPMGLTATVK